MLGGTRHKLKNKHFNVSYASNSEVLKTSEKSDHLLFSATIYWEIQKFMLKQILSSS